MIAYVSLNPDGTAPFGLAVIVHAKTGVVYANQCAGFATEIREAEGFLVPVGCTDPSLEDDQTNIENAIDSFFKQRFRHYPPPHAGEEWTPGLVDELGALIGRIVVWRTGRDDEPTEPTERTYLALDRSRLAELTEAWIPVVTPYGAGTLVTDNSD
jgi:hypothetical protein